MCIFFKRFIYFGERKKMQWGETKGEGERGKSKQTPC